MTTWIRRAWAYFDDWLYFQRNHRLLHDLAHGDNMRTIWRLESICAQMGIQETTLAVKVPDVLRPQFLRDTLAEERRHRKHIYEHLSLLSIRLDLLENRNKHTQPQRRKRNGSKRSSPKA